MQLYGCVYRLLYTILGAGHHRRTHFQSVYFIASVATLRHPVVPKSPVVSQRNRIPSLPGDTPPFIYAKFVAFFTFTRSKHQQLQESRGKLFLANNRTGNSCLQSWFPAGDWKMWTEYGAIESQWVHSRFRYLHMYMQITQGKWMESLKTHKSMLQLMDGPPLLGKMDWCFNWKGL